MRRGGLGNLLGKLSVLMHAVLRIKSNSDRLVRAPELDNLSLELNLSPAQHDR
ncbi:hypothetical protein NDU88_000311, partial [Pleurodeles waltl]